MTEFDDLDLDKPDAGSDFHEGKRGIRLAALGAAVLVTAAALIYIATTRWAKPRESPVTKAEPAPAAEATVPPVAGERITLPPLAETDPIVRELVRRLSSHPKVAAWLATRRLIANFTVVTINISEGRTPRVHLRPLVPQARFRTKQSRGALVVDAQSYERYNDYADAVAALDAEGTARLYATLKPRIRDAYRELGQPDGDFDPVLERAIVELLRTPVVDGDIELRAKTISYELADPQLESLLAAQKQLLRMGPRNVRLVQAKLRAIAASLGIPASRLPRIRS